MLRMLSRYGPTLSGIIKRLRVSKHRASVPRGMELADGNLPGQRDGSVRHLSMAYPNGEGMAKLNQKIKIALDESRMLILGTQILLGFQYRAIFERAFEKLPPTSQYLKLAALGILLIAIALIMWPGAYHRIVWQGRDSNDVHEFTTNVMDVALLPFLIALSIDFYVIDATLLGAGRAIALAIGMGVAALIFWYGLGRLSRYRGWDRELKSGRKKEAEVPKT